MSGLLQEQMRQDLESLGWECEESHADGRWTTMLRRDGTSIVSTGVDRQLVWNAAYRDALRRSGKQGA